MIGTLPLFFGGFILLLFGICWFVTEFRSGKDVWDGPPLLIELGLFAILLGGIGLIFLR